MELLIKKTTCNHAPKQKKNYNKTLDEVGLPKNILNKFPAELSVGVQKRVGLARAIVKEPKVLILDEPLNHLDAHSRNKICEALNIFVSRPNKAIIMVSHDLESISRYAQSKLRYLEMKRC